MALLSFVISGEAVHLLDDEKFVQKGPSIAITHYGMEHTIVTPKGQVDIFNIYLDLEKHSLPPLPSPLDNILPDFIPIHPRFQNKLNRVLRIDFDDQSKAVNLVFSLHEELENQSEGFEDSAIMYFKLLLIDICRQALRSGIKPSVKANSGRVSRLEKLRRFIDANYHDDQNLDVLAKMVKMNKAVLCREFKKYTGKTVFSYLLERRIQAAMLKLSATEEKIISIAFECGFNDLSFFNRTFKRFTGSTPSSYRKTKTSR